MKGVFIQVPTLLTDFRETSQDLAPILIAEKTVDKCHHSTVTTQSPACCCNK